MEKFLLNHQYNRMAREARNLLSALQTSSDRKVVEAARQGALTKAAETCEGLPPALSEAARPFVERLGTLRSTEEFEQFLHELASCVLPFGEVSESRLRSLFPKVKKLRMPPDLDTVKDHPLTYLGWTDSGTGRMFLVYPRGADGAFAGLEGRFTPSHKKGVCAFCNRSGETVLFTAESKAKLAHLPDYYKAVGQYICQDSGVCNGRITDTEALERFFEAVGR